MTRNMEKLSEEARKAIPAEYDINSVELSRLRDMIYSGDKDKVFEAVCMAFNFGFVMGNRATRRGKVKAL